MVPGLDPISSVQFLSITRSISTEGYLNCAAHSISVFLSLLSADQISSSLHCYLLVNNSAQPSYIMSQFAVTSYFMSRRSSAIFSSFAEASNMPY